MDADVDRVMYEIEADVARKKADGQTMITGVECADYLARVFEAMSPMMSVALWNHPSAKNYLEFSFKSDKQPQYDFEVVIHKKGHDYPPIQPKNTSEEEE